VRTDPGALAQLVDAHVQAFAGPGDLRTDHRLVDLARSTGVGQVIDQDPSLSNLQDLDSVLVAIGRIGSNLAVLRLRLPRLETYVDPRRLADVAQRQHWLGREHLGDRLGFEHLDNWFDNDFVESRVELGAVQVRSAVLVGSAVLVRSSVLVRSDQERRFSHRFRRSLLWGSEDNNLAVLVRDRVAIGGPLWPDITGECLLMEVRNLGGW
jgi:hypothetical protein